MYTYKLLILYYFCALSFADNAYVVELTDRIFDQTIAEHQTILVMFYSPGCTGCKELKGQYFIAAENLIYEEPPIMLAEVDCKGQGQKTCSRYKIDNYPTLKIFRRGKFSHNYEGLEDARGIIDYMIKLSEPVPKQLVAMEELESFLESEDDVCVVGFFEDESDLKIAFLKVTEWLAGKVVFAIFEGKDAGNKVVLYRPVHLRNVFENDNVTYTGDAVIEGISDFITNNYHGLVGYRTVDNTNDFETPLIVAYFTVDYKRNSKRTNYWRNRILQFAAEYQSKITFAFSSKDDFENELKMYFENYTEISKPMIVATNSKNQKFIMQDPFSITNFDIFIKDFLDEKIPPFVRSEPLPETNQESVKVAVAKNFHEVVTNNDKDTLIEFYAPWCGHCKKLAPIYDELGDKMKHEDVEIVKMNADANDIPSGFEIHGYPTIYWVSKDSKDKPVTYDGRRSLDDFVKYIAKHATVELRGFDRKGNPKEMKTEL